MTATRAAWAALMTVAEPGLRVFLRARAWRGKEVAGRLSERRGIERSPRPPGRLVWLHAASVGETVSILPLLDALRLLAPEATRLVTTGTVTSARVLSQRADAAVLHRFAPLDVPRWARAFLRHWRPSVAAFVESELWPNIIAACRHEGVPAALINGRLSRRSAARWSHLPATARDLLGDFAVIDAQSPADADRLRALGAAAVNMPGNLKFASPPLPADPAEVDRLRSHIGGRPRWLFASTHPGEEAMAMRVHRQLSRRYPGLLTIVAPRHPERGERIAADAGGAPRRARGEPPGAVWIADTLGELGLLCRLSRVVVMGRSFVPPGGGQNPLEPARLGCAVGVGPFAGNFADPVARLERAGGLARLADETALAAWLDALLSDHARADAMGEAARAAADAFADLPADIARRLIALMA